MATIGGNIQLAKKKLDTGNLVAIPTETVYGLAANALDEGAVLKIFVAKNRPTFDPLIIHTDTIAKLYRYVSAVPGLALVLAQELMPGPLTLLLPKQDIIPDLVTSGLPNVAVRIPSHALTLSLLNSLAFPLAAPSANPFGYISPTTAQHVADQLGKQVSYILDGGTCSVGIESTIIGFENHKPIIYRKGGIAVETIEKIVGKVLVREHSSSNPQAPGMLKSHYSPRCPVVTGNIQDLLELNHEKKVGILTFKQDFGQKNQEILSEIGSFQEAARNLFAALRRLDKLNLDIIIAELLPEKDLGRAINDRLRRAAS